MKKGMSPLKAQLFHYRAVLFTLEERLAKFPESGIENMTEVLNDIGTIESKIDWLETAIKTKQRGFREAQQRELNIKTHFAKQTIAL